MALDRRLKTLVTDRVDRSRVGKTSAILRLRLTITVVIAALAVAWWAWAGGNKTTFLYSPGHVTRAHAKFEQDCQKCHDGDGRGGFSKAVSDNACLKCHDGSMHHPNQLTAKDAAGVSPAKLVMAVTDAHRPTGNMTRSAACIACHVEHRDQSTLLASDDRHCTQCHAAIGKSATSQPSVPDGIVAFNPVNHPAFGESLMQVDPEDGKRRLFDPTQLKFDHRKHLTQPELNNPNACVACHVPAAVPGDAEKPRTPPFGKLVAFGDDRSSASRKYMQPVKFEQHCIGCHQLELPSTVASLEVTVDDEKTNSPLSPIISGVVLRHRDLAEVRDQIAAAVQGKMPTDPKAFTVPEPADAAASIKTLPPDQKWMRVNLLAMADDVGGAVKRRSVEATFDASVMKLPDEPKPEQLTASRLADFYTVQAVFSGKNACISCHSVTGGLPTIDAPAATPLATVATGIPKTPRHWFAKSQFDHGRHEQMSCIECHSNFSQANLGRIAAIPDAAQQKAEMRMVTETSFVNSPNQTWTEWVTTGGQLTSKTRSCAECHHADEPGNRGNGSACVMCHQFHDRTKELLGGTAAAK